ncbi:MAG: tRNA lysidine(34) synthetase TilS, partial [Deltaproteobacteria bacterium]|nr:tRNA lysidine(34) synthetase TilS [Deltaproteobacteria bacterium]
GQGLTWVEDSSNQDLRFFRNRVRHALLPWLKKEFNPAVDEALLRTAHLLRDEEAVWADLVREAVGHLDWHRTGDRISLDLRAFRRLEPAMARRLVRAVIEDLTGATRSLTMTHVDAVIDLTRGPGGRRTNLPAGLVAGVEGRRLVIGPPRPGPPPSFSYTLAIPGRTVIPELNISLDAEILDWTADRSPKHNDPRTATMDLDRVVLPLMVRSLRSGDRFRPLGLTGAKKLSDFFIDRRVPAWQRSKVPLIVDQNHLVWIAGYCVDDRVKITSETRRVIVIKEQSRP